MKKYTLLLPVILVLAFSSGCKKISTSSSSNPSVTTLEAADILGNSATLGGIISNNGGSDIAKYGVVWSTSSSPSIGDHEKTVTGNTSGTFTMTVDNLTPGQLIYVRAYAQNNAGKIGYGNVISFQSGNGILSQPVTNVLPKSVTFRGNTVSTTQYTIFQRGFCWNTLPNPTVSNTIQYATSGGFGNFTIEATGFIPNTLYYARPFFDKLGTIVYGDEITFTTTGYYGDSGGFIFYDKGEITNGWRYLEAAPTAYTAPNGWGCYGTLISNTYPTLGTGENNTGTFVSVCTSTGFPARYSFDYSINGLSDWFLPSTDEAIFMTKAFNQMGFSGAASGNFIWTSTEFDALHAYAVLTDASVNSELKNSTFIPFRSIRSF